MSRSLCVLCLIAAAFVVGSCSGPEKTRIGVLEVGTEQSIKSVTDWLTNQPDLDAVSMELDEAAAPRVEVIWLHLPDEASQLAAKPRIEQLANWIATRYEEGVPVLLTGYAALLPQRMGLETQPPEVRKDTLTGTDWFFSRKRGLQSLFGHPAFDGLNKGAALYDPKDETVVSSIGYFGENWPNPGKVVAVEKRYITIDDQRKLMVEYGDDPTRLMCIGGFVFLSGENLQRHNLDIFLHDVLTDLASPSEDARSFWRKPDSEVREVAVDAQPLPIPREETVNPGYSGLRIDVETPGSAPWDISGRRTLVMGKERAGIDEIWTHPIRALREYRVGIQRENGVQWLDRVRPTLAIRPESIERTWTLPEGTLHELVVAAFNAPGGYMRYDLEGEPVTLVVEARSDLRWMWPYDSSALGGLKYGIDESTGAVHVSDAWNHYEVILGADRIPKDEIAGGFKSIRYDEDALVGVSVGNDILYSARYGLGGKQSTTLHVGYAGGRVEGDDVPTVFRSMLTRPDGILAEQVDHVRELLSNSLTLETPDEEFNRLWKWAIIGTDRFWTTTPELGTALVAGFATSDRGWDGKQVVSGRPGYAWYFGRDGVWSSFAVDAYGDAAMVRQQLEFLQKFQDARGMIFHELTTSGSVHYDAADATPLYILLMAHYVRASGDVAFLRGSWEHVERAMEFLHSTDANSDGLIDNVNVGHGWVEGGALWGAQSSFYLTGIWQRCLADASYLAGHAGEGSKARRWASEAESVLDILHTDFFDADHGKYNFALMPDGSYNHESTIMTAPVALFGALADSTMSTLLDEWASNGFSSDWGLRILSTQSSLYNRSAYHAGSVWPLYTGWTSLAEYTYGRSLAGFSHMMNNLRIKNYWAEGFIEEVMDGDTYEPAGVCWHQCWSETNVLQPGIEGMVGWKPDAPRRRATLSPRFPVQWDSVTVKNLRIADTVLDFHFVRKENRQTYSITRREGRPVSVALAPELPEGSIITVAWSNGLPVTISSNRSRGVLAEPFTLHTDIDAELVLQLRGGISVLPVVTSPHPGDKSEGYRVVHAQLQGPVYVIEVEGPAGGSMDLRLRNFGKKIENVLAAEILEARDGWVKLRVDFPESDESFVRKTVNVLIER